MNGEQSCKRCHWPNGDCLDPALARLLRDPKITISRDKNTVLSDGRTLFDLLDEWRNAPCPTASATASAEALASKELPPGCSKGTG